MIEISSPDKVLWPALGITKADLADYYEAVADRLLPALLDRPVTLKHHPRGVDEDGFMRKNVPDHVPDVIRRWTTYARTARRDVSYALIDSVEALRWCAGQNVVEFHPCLFRVDEPTRLDTVVIDLDPGTNGVDVAEVAVWIREVLDEVSLAAAVKTSGGRGLHLTIPVKRRYSTAQLRRFADAVADVAVSRHPDAICTEFEIEARGGRLFVDCTRVGVGATLISAWSPRARSEATVSTPLLWNEVTRGLDVVDFTQSTVAARPEPPIPEPQTIDDAATALGVPVADE